MAWANEAIHTTKRAEAPILNFIPYLSSLKSDHTHRTITINGRKKPPRPKVPLSRLPIKSPTMPILSVNKLMIATIDTAIIIRLITSSKTPLSSYAFGVVFRVFFFVFFDEVVFRPPFFVFVRFLPVDLTLAFFVVFLAAVFFCAIISPHKNPVGLHN